MSIIKKDLFRYSGKTGGKTFLFGFLRIPGFRYMVFFRNSKKYSIYNPIGFINRILYFHFSYKYGFQIPIATNIGHGFYIGHFGTIVINRNAIIGDNCNIAHNVTIGQANRGKRQGAPIIGNKVWIGTGSVIVGKITIGDNVLIAPNAYVNFDVPSNSLVLGNPAVIHPKDESIIDGYIEHTI